jgi:hypothetical protein
MLILPGDLRALIRTLKLREAELRQRMIAHRLNAPLEGAQYTVTLRSTERRVFDTALLPDSIRTDSRYISMKTTMTITAKRQTPAQTAQ